MAERYFLALLVILVVISSFWLAFFVNPVFASEALAVLLGLLGLAAVLNANRVKAGVLMPLFFVAAIAYAVYLYLVNPVVGYLLALIPVISLVGLVVSFRVVPRPVKVASKASQKAAKPLEVRSAKRKPFKKRGRPFKKRGRKGK